MPASASTGGIAVIGMILFLVLFVLAMVFWIWMIVDCAKRKFKESSEKIIWIVLIAILGVIAAIIYYFAIKRKEDKSHALPKQTATQVSATIHRKRKKAKE